MSLPVSLGSTASYEWIAPHMSSWSQRPAIQSVGTSALQVTGLATIDVSAGRSATIGASITGEGGILKTGDGTLTLTGASDYDAYLGYIQGGTVLKGGRLVVDGGQISHSGKNLAISSGSFELTDNGSAESAMTLIGNLGYIGSPHAEAAVSNAMRSSRRSMLVAVAPDLRLPGRQVPNGYSTNSTIRPSGPRQ